MGGEKCAVCCKLVTRRQHALQCDKCDRWTHRLCGTASLGQFYSARSLKQHIADRIYTSDEDERSDVENDYGDSTFDISRSYAQPEIQHEESIQDDTVTSPPTADSDHVSYYLIDNASQRGHQKLADSLGFTYNKKRKRGEKVDWQCTVRNSHTKCPATVIQHDQVFTTGKSNHSHTSVPGIKTAVQITAQVKQHAKDNVFQSAAAIVEDAYLDHADPSAPEASRPAHANLVRIANRAREKLRPKEPQTMDFEIASNFIPNNFLRKDIMVEGNRHIVFATSQQLEILSKAKIWFLDGTFKIIRQPFIQLFTIHSFIRQGEDMKQIPLVFCFMSRRRKKDYKKVLSHVRKLMPTPPAVTEMVTDYEIGIWKGINHVFPDVTVRGCAYHWTQAIWRRVQELGLQSAYQNDDGVFKYVRKVMALPFLPEEHITPAFNKLNSKAAAGQISLLMEYVENYWIKGVWSVSSWCVFGQPIRTNNDVEGWHRRINHKSREASLPFYVLVPLLHKEASLLPIQMKLVSEGKLRRYQRSNTVGIQAKLFSIWESYNEDRISASALLRECSKLNGPIRD